jgi:homoserine dehydrogenase
LAKSDIHIIVEATNDVDAAWHIVKEGLLRKIPVVTANKKLLANKLEDILRLRITTGTPIYYESAAAASIPIFQTIDRYYNFEKLHELSGIVNGTTNYILSNMAERNIEFATVLLEAQEKGYAESNPSSDIDGWDATYKAVLLTAHAFGDILQPADIVRYGIRFITSADVAYAKQLGKKIRLVFKAQKVFEQTSVVVLPTLVDENSAFYHVSDAYNAILVQLADSGEQLLTGKGAGSLPTGATILKDVFQALEGFTTKNNKLKVLATILHKPLIELELVLRVSSAISLTLWPEIKIERVENIGQEQRIHGWIHAEAFRKYAPSWEEKHVSVLSTGKTRATEFYQKIPDLKNQKVTL